MGYQQYCGEGFVQWADLQVAEGWFREVMELASPARAPGYDAAGADKQYAVVQAVWVALGKAYKALRIRPTADPGYRAMIAKWAGNLVQTFENAQAQHLGPAKTFGSQWMTVPENSDMTPSERAHWEGLHRTGEIMARLGAQWQTMGKRPLQPAGVSWGPQAVFRIYLDELAEVQWNYGPLELRTGMDWFPRPFAPIGCARWGTPGEGCDNKDWRFWAWNDGAEDVQFLPPLFWFVGMAGEVAADAFRRGMGQVVYDARTSALAANIATIRELIHEGRITEQQAGSRAALDALTTLSVSLPADYAANQQAYRDQAVAAVSATAGAIAAGVAAVPVVGWILGPLIAGGAALGALITRLLPPLELQCATCRDIYGRAEPVLELGSLDDSPGSSTPPSVVIEPTGRFTGVSSLGPLRLCPVVPGSSSPSSPGPSTPTESAGPVVKGAPGEVTAPSAVASSSRTALWVGAGALGVAVLGGVWAATRK